MGDNILDVFSVNINCDTNSCALRYYVNENELAIGLIRFQHYKKEGKIPQTVVTIASMDIDRMIEYMMETYNIDTKYGELLVKTIRLDSQQRVKDHLGVNVITPDRV